MIPVYLGDPSGYLDNYSRNKLHIRIDKYSKTLCAISSVEIIIPIIDESNYQQVNEPLETCILIVKSDTVSKCLKMYNHLSMYCSSIRVIAQEYWKWGDREINDFIITQKRIQGDELDVIGLAYRNDCKAGVSEYAYCPNQKIYPCPGYYYYGLEPIGDIDMGISNDFASLVALNRSQECVKCNSSQCQRCSLVNTLRHGMPNIPANIQCKINLIHD
jgi:hypothetical protein